MSSEQKKKKKFDYYALKASNNIKHVRAKAKPFMNMCVFFLCQRI